MLELTLAYLAAAALISGLIFMARRNQKQGWRKPREIWRQAPAPMEVRAEPGLAHLGDLGRLQQSLATESETVHQEQLVHSR